MVISWPFQAIDSSEKWLLYIVENPEVKSLLSSFLIFWYFYILEIDSYLSKADEKQQCK